MTTYADLLNCEHDMRRDLCAICASERNQQEYEALAEMTGNTIEDIEADLTAPDPNLEEDPWIRRWNLI